MSAEEISERESMTKLKESLHVLKQDAHELQSRASATLRELSDRTARYREDAGEIIDAMAEYCKENPQRAALIAAGAGLGLGVILGLLMRGK
jgi:ElaB protein